MCISDRSQQVVYGGQLSPTQSVQFRVRRRSVLGPLLFVLYTADLSRVVANHTASSSCSSTLTTVNSTSTRQSTMLQRRSSDCPAVSTTLKPGWVQADCDWTQPRHLWPRLLVSTAQAQHSTRSSPVNIRQDCRLSTWSWSGDRQWLNDVWSRDCRLSLTLLSASSTTYDCTFVVRRCHEDVSPVVRFLPTRLKNWHIGYSIAGKCSHNFGFRRRFVFAIRSPYGTNRQTDGRTDGQDP